MEISKYIYFLHETLDTSKDYLNLLGNKANNLIKLYHLESHSIKVPSGFVIGANVIRSIVETGVYPDNFFQVIKDNINKLGVRVNKEIGNIHKPLLLSIRSSGSISMPGILDTMLNVGINTYMKEHMNDFFSNLHERNICNVKEDVYQQVNYALQLVIDSLKGDKIQKYFPEGRPDINMGIIVQEMVFGNRNSNSYTGVVFSSNPHDGLDLFGEFLQEEQGDSLVGGKITPLSVIHLKQQQPKVYEELFKICKYLEREFGYIQDVEFTIEDGELYILQTRNAQLSLSEKILMLERFLQEGLITKKEFLQHVDTIENITNNYIDYNPSIEIIGEGLAATGNVIGGVLAVSFESCKKFKEKGETVIFAAHETTPDHMDALNLSSGLLTVRGGATSHAAVIARGRNMVCVLSVEGMKMLDNAIEIKNNVIKEGDILTVDANRGLIIKGSLPIQVHNHNYDFLSWRCSPIKIRVNGETVADIENGHRFRMSGIGLCRIEHMLLKEEGLKYLRQLLLNNSEDNQKLLEHYLEIELLLLLKAMKGLPITIRLMDPPLHEFLPAEELKEHNPMMGNRGARLMITYENLCALQIRSIFISNFVKMEEPLPVEIMVPFVFHVRELQAIKKIINEVEKEIFQVFHKKVNYKFGVMIEVPRAVFIAEEIAKEVDFISFGTNDLTQMTLGLSRDDSNFVIAEYIKKGIIKHDPFITLDSVVRELISLCIDKVLKVNKHIKIGICGEQAADKESLQFLSTLPLSYISCSPFRVQTAAFYLNKFSTII